MMLLVFNEQLEGKVAQYILQKAAAFMNKTIDELTEGLFWAKIFLAILGIALAIFTATHLCLSLIM